MCGRFSAGRPVGDLSLGRSRSVVATCRDPDAAADLQALRDAHPEHLTLVQLDVTDEASINVRPIPNTHGNPQYPYS